MKNGKHTKKVVAISIEPLLDDLMNEMFGNKSKYVEWLIHQDMLKNLPENEKLKKMII